MRLGSVCALNLVLPETGDSEGHTHYRPSECGGGQAIQARPDHPDRVVSPSRVLLVDIHQASPTSDLFATRFNNKLALFLSPVPDPLCG